MKLTTARALLLTTMALTAPLQTGCAPLSLQAVPLATNRATIQVDIIGVDDTDAAELNKFSPLDWFGNTNRSASALRANFKEKGAIKSATLGPTDRILIPKDDPLWSVWKEQKANKIAVIAQPISSVIPEKNSFMRIFVYKDQSFDNDVIVVKVSDTTGLQITPAAK